MDLVIGVIDVLRRMGIGKQRADPLRRIGSKVGGGGGVIGVGQNISWRCGSEGLEPDCVGRHVG